MTVVNIEGQTCYWRRAHIAPKAARLLDEITDCQLRLSQTPMVDAPWMLAVSLA